MRFGRATTVNAFFFVYTVTLMLVCFSAALLSLSAYVVSHRKAFLPQVSFFCAYVIELASIFGNEWLAQNIPFSPNNYYAVDMPVLRITTGTVVLLSLWAMLLDILDVHDRRMLFVPAIAFVVACVGVLALMPYGALRQWLFYSLRQAFTGAALAFAAWRYKTTDNDAYRTRLSRYRRHFAVLCALTLLVFVEDCFVILAAPIPPATSGWTALYLSSRNFSENLMMVFVAYLCIRQSVATLALRFDAPPAAHEGGDLERHVDELLPLYAKSHGLSPRETEVLAHVIEGKTNREIANELVLSEGTVKTHVHNIMRKCETKTRDELRRDFWA